MKVLTAQLMVAFLAHASLGFADSIDEDIKNLSKEYSGEQMKATSDILAAGQSTVPRLASNLTNSNPTTRKWCVILLRRMNDRSNFNELKDLALNDSDWLVREAAIVSISEFKRRRLSI